MFLPRPLFKRFVAHSPKSGTKWLSLLHCRSLGAFTPARWTCTLCLDSDYLGVNVSGVTLNWKLIGYHSEVIFHCATGFHCISGQQCTEVILFFRFVTTDFFASRFHGMCRVRIVWCERNSTSSQSSLTLHWLMWMHLFNHCSIILHDVHGFASAGL